MSDQLRLKLPSEAELQEALIAHARLRGWMVAHFRPARTQKGWSTPIEGDRGFPDLILAKAGQAFAWELKGPRGVLGAGQVEWLEALAGNSVGLVEARVVGPHDLDTAIRALDLGRWPR